MMNPILIFYSHQKILRMMKKLKLIFEATNFDQNKQKLEKKKLPSHLVLKKNHFWFWFQKVESGLLVQHVNDPCRAAELDSSISCWNQLTLDI